MICQILCFVCKKTTAYLDEAVLSFGIVLSGWLWYNINVFLGSPMDKVNQSIYIKYKKGREFIQRVITVIFTLIALCFQHLIHEYSHVLTASLCGKKVTRIQWLTYHGGTRVFFENEPTDYKSAQTDKKWAFIAISGFVATIILGYLFVFLYFVIENSWIKVGLCFFSIIFLAVDSIYFALGSVFSFGDIVGFREICKIPKWLSVVLCVGILFMNCTVIYICFYRTA